MKNEEFDLLENLAKKLADEGLFEAKAKLSDRDGYDWELLLKTKDNSK